MLRRHFIQLGAAMTASLGVRPTLLMGAEDTWPDHPYLKGNYAPVFDELDVDGLTLVGELPSELNGMYVRNGPNPQFPPISGDYHWFDGDGMVHGVWIEDGAASYRNRWVMTEGLRSERQAGQALWPSIEGRQRDRRAPRDAPRFKNVANTSVVWHGGRLFACWEGGDPHVLSVPHLKTQGTYDFGGTLDHAFTAHPKVDPRTGDLVAFGYDMIKKPYVKYSVFDKTGALKHKTSLDIPNGVMMHDCAITERYTLFLDLPVRLNLRKALTGRPPLQFVPRYGARIGVLPRMGDGAEVKWFDVNLGFVFHTLNAWEEGDEVVLYGCRFETFPEFSDALNSRDEPSFRDPTLPYLYRWRLNMATGAVKEEWLADRSSEFPRVDGGLLGVQSRYGYAISKGGGAWIKYDLDTGADVRHDHGDTRVAGEPTFVASRGGGDGEGFLMGYVYDQQSNSSELVVVDTTAFDGPPIARVSLPRRVPHGFHGTWVPGSEVDSPVASR